MPLTGQRLMRKSFDQPDEIRPFEGKGHLEIVDANGIVGRAVFEPGWRWSNDVKPIAGTDSCMAAHIGYVISGRMHIRMDNGDEEEFAPGDVLVCPPGHDGWVVGDDQCVIVDWSGYGDYAKR